MRPSAQVEVLIDVAIRRSPRESGHDGRRRRSDEGLRSVLRNPGTSSDHARAKTNAARTLARLQGERLDAPAPPTPVDDAHEMAMLRERLCPGWRVHRDDDPDGQDCFRHLDARLQLGGREADPRIWTRLPWCPEDVAGAQAAVLDALERLDVGPGPSALPDDY